MTSHLGNWLKQELRTRGWTQAILATRASVSREQVARMCRQPTWSLRNGTRRGIAAALEIDDDELRWLISDVAREMAGTA